MNVLVYNGPGASPSAVKDVLVVLRHFLEPYYAVSTISALALKNEPWAHKSAALVFPGGADLPYCKECKPALPLIKRFVAKGGIYVGFCAGGYFGTSRVEFSVGEALEVVGNRDLKFFPGTGRGPALRGFQYNSEKGSYAVKLKSVFPDAPSFTSYFNGGSVFVDAHLHDNVEILATYDQPIDVPYVDNEQADPSIPAAAVVLCSVGKGKALLTGPHPEFNPHLLKSSSQTSYTPAVLDALIRDEPARLTFMKEALTKTGFACNENFLSSHRLSLTPEFVCSLDTQLLEDFLVSLGAWDKTDQCYKLTCETDTFEIRKGFSEYKKLEEGLKDIPPETAVKQLLVGTKEELVPATSITPSFDMSKYLMSLDKGTSLGSILIYGDVVTSTSVLLEENKKLLAKFAGHSVLHVGSIQSAGRGRGGNSWVHPRGVSASTVTCNVPLKSPRSGTPVSIVFVQYLAMVACCEAILSYGEGFEDMPVRIKWPNDLYALDPKYYSSKKLKLLGNRLKASLPSGTDVDPAYVKISGMLVNTHFADGQYSVLLGCGLNVSNKAPTISLKTWVDILNSERRDNGQSLLPDIDEEVLLAKYINNLDKLLAEFIDFGPQVILPRYYRLWLHTGQIVRLTDHYNARVKIEGITSDFGLLFVRELKNGTDDQYTGSTFTLQPDGNTFDIFNGLISKKYTQR